MNGGGKGTISWSFDGTCQQNWQLYQVYLTPVS